MGQDLTPEDGWFYHPNLCQPRKGTLTRPSLPVHSQDGSTVDNHLRGGGGAIRRQRQCGSHSARVSRRGHASLGRYGRWRWRRWLHGRWTGMRCWPSCGRRTSMMSNEQHWQHVSAVPYLPLPPLL